MGAKVVILRFQGEQFEAVAEQLQVHSHCLQEIPFVAAFPEVPVFAENWQESLVAAFRESALEELSLVAACQ